MKICYLSGSITNGGTLPFDGAVERFAHAAAEVKQRWDCMVISPVDPNIVGESWHWCMRRAIQLLMKCDGVYMLRGWKDSRGARLEHLIATALDFEVNYQEGARS